MSSEPRLLSPFETAAHLVRAFYRVGLRHVIISPGSRSTPLTMAFASHEGFNKNVLLDERAAAFTALGIGKDSGKPAILVCTSGTAAANYHPAIAEARESGVPMIVCTADRPPSLRGVGSSQTLDQIKLYGDSAVWFHELGEPAHSERDIQRLDFVAHQATVEAIESGGASHINIPFRKPLEPTREMISHETELIGHQLANHSAENELDDRSRSTVYLSDHTRRLINNSLRPLIIAGPSDPLHNQRNTAVQLAERLSAPIIGEPGSGITTHDYSITHFDQLLRQRDKWSDLAPDLIIRFGDQPFSKSLLSAIHRYRQVPLIRFDARRAWQDHEMNSSVTVKLSKSDSLDMTGIKPKKNRDYLSNWQQAGTNAQAHLTSTLEQTKTLSDGHVFQHLASKVPADWNVMLSNSLPVRDAALFGSPPGQIFMNRGVAGIDGIMSTAIGTALSSGAPTCCVIGDLAFLHDSNALLSVKYLNSPFVIVVVNNNGGNIFRMLPIHEHDDVYTDYFETPQSANIEHLALAHSLEYQRITSLDELTDLSFDNDNAFSKPTIIECVTSPDDSMALRRTLWGS